MQNHTQARCRTTGGCATTGVLSTAAFSVLSLPFVLTPVGHC